MGSKDQCDDSEARGLAEATEHPALTALLPNSRTSFGQDCVQARCTYKKEQHRLRPAKYRVTAVKFTCPDDHTLVVRLAVGHEIRFASFCYEQ